VYCRAPSRDRSILGRKYEETDARASAIRDHELPGAVENKACGCRCCPFWTAGRRRYGDDERLRDAGAVVKSAYASTVVGDPPRTHGAAVETPGIYQVCIRRRGHPWNV